MTEETPDTCEQSPALSGVAPATPAKCARPKPGDEERLDVFNGLLLAPHLDALFDGGWITFADDGGMLVSGALGADARNKLDLESWAGLAYASEAHGPYLEYHRSAVFRKGQGGR